MSLSGAESYLVGIAPHYWAHVPMAIADLQHLKILDGIHFALVRQQGFERKLVPLSKCLLVGYIVNVEVKSGSMRYVVDDGTGLIDCIDWSLADQSGFHTLPSLFQISNPCESRQQFRLGDLVRIFGKIQCLSIDKDARTLSVSGWDHLLHDSICELQITLMEGVEQRSLNSEARHWIACGNSVLSCDDENSNQQSTIDYMKILGTGIQQQVQDRRHWPAAGGTSAEWRLFGEACCCNVSYKKSLLYCHCQAKVEPLDPEFKFRDELLSMLLDLQKKHDKKLCFPYKRIANDEKLRTLALDHIKESKKAACSEQFAVDRLIMNTFRALRHDGILYLMDSDADTYLLITREKVLEPLVRNKINESSNLRRLSRESNRINRFFSLEAAPFLSKVHYERLHYIQRIISNESPY